MTTLININNLSKSFDQTTVFSNLQLTINKGDIYGLLGANGAGKTTLLKLITGFLEPTEGSISVLGKNSWEDRNQTLTEIGSLIETPIFYEHLTAHENLSIHLSYMHTQGDIDKTLTLVGLTNIKDKPVSKFSLGMRQRLAIARAIIHKPKILLLDEPINGLDPVAIREMRELFQLLSKDGMTIIISSHIMSEVELTVTRVGVITQGRLVLDSDMTDLKKAHPNDLEDYLIQCMRGASS